MNTIIAILAVLLIVAVLFGGLLKSAAAVAYQRLKTLRLPRLPHWSGKVTINLWQAGLLTVALALLFWSGAGRGCSGPLPAISWPWGGSTAPFKADSLTVLVVEESNPSQDSNAPAWVNATNAGSIRKYVAGRGGEFRLIDQHNPTDIAGTKWQAAMAVERKSVPWIVAAGPRTGFSKPLPATAAETLSLLEGVK